MHFCPKCNSRKVHRSRARSRWEILRKSVTPKRVFRCHACGWRGWGVDMGPAFGHGQRRSGAHAAAEDAPNLEGTELARPDVAATIDVSSLDMNMADADSKPRMITEVPACDVEPPRKQLRP